MGYTLAIYTNEVYREIRLPMVDNMDYMVNLSAKDFLLHYGITLQLEVIDGIWHIKKTVGFQVCSHNAGYAGDILKQGLILKVETDESEQLTIQVWENEKDMSASSKYAVLNGRRITIGRGEGNDICCDSLPINSQSHAAITYLSRNTYIEVISPNGTYLNGLRIEGKQKLHFGDIINIYGLSIIYMEDLLAVSSLDANARVKRENLKKITGFDSEEANDNGLETMAAETMVHISPRSLPELYDGVEKIENVPAKREVDKKPAWMSILPSLTMAIPMLLGFALMGSGMAMGLVIAVGSAVVGVTWATINLRYSREQQRQQELTRLRRYSEYLVQCADRIREKFEHNRLALLNAYPDAESCSHYTANSHETWARSRRHSDFLFVRLGLGEMPFQVAVTAPKQEFMLIPDELAERPGKIADSYQTMSDVPLGVRLRDHSVVGILSVSSENQMSAVRIITTQIVLNHCYTDVKIAALYDGNSPCAEQWASMKWMPHIWNEERNFRYLASNQDEINDVLYALGQVLRSRTEQTNAGGIGNKAEHFPHYILFVESPRLLESQTICKFLYERGTELGITTIILSDDYDTLPGTCSLIVEDNPGFGGIYGSQNEDHFRNEIDFDFISAEQFIKMAYGMASWRVNEVESSSAIPNSLTFFEMMGVHHPQELQVLEHWKKNRTYESMSVLIGQKAGGAGCYLNIHEKAHGPHGLVAGTTGSGKSETLQTYILSLAASFSPWDVGFFIIDFKGGGMANLFSNLPHMLGQISNLSGNQVRRAMISIKSENHRRQQIFSDYGVNNINDYTKLVKNGEAETPLPHLLIIIDEFAELKREQPAFMDELISVSQVGRSLGVHLILATQKPSGTVNDNIWSNTRFKLCLRVADKQDSQDMLHKPDAAYLTQAGRCYLQVGEDEEYELFQSGWSGAPYDPDQVHSESSAVMIDLLGREAVVGHGKSENTFKKKKEIRQLDAVVDYLAEIARENGYRQTQPLWLPVLPERLYLEQLEGYESSIYRNNTWPEHREFGLSAYIGLVDAPEVQRQFPLIIDFVKNGHLAIVGGVTSGKSTMMQSICYSLIQSYSPAELNLYVIDFSSQMLCAFEGDAHVGGIVLEGEDERLNKLFGLLSMILKERKQTIRGGSFSQYVRVHGNTMPAVILAIDGYANFRDKTGDKYESVLMELVREAEGYGIYLMISCGSFGGAELQNKIADKMRQGICLELSDKYKYGDVLHQPRFDVLPETNVKGRGLVCVGDEVFEYQTALAFEAENDYMRSEKITEICAAMSVTWIGQSARKIPEIPANPVWDQFRELPEYQALMQTGTNLPCAYDQATAMLYSIDLSKTYCYLVLGREQTGKSTFLRNLACAAKDTGGEVWFVDREDKKDEVTAKYAETEYVASAREMFEAIKHLVILTNERGVKRKELQEKYLTDEEICREMQKNYPPIFYVIADLADFIQRIYTRQEGVGLLNSSIETIFAKGRLLNVYFFAGLDVDSVGLVSVRSAGQSFLREQAGVLLGGELNKQNLFSYRNVKYNEQAKRLKNGFAYAVNQDDSENVDMIVVPQNRGVMK
ncbi:MAG: type VII secretion protein EssC [Lachnospiraceae bacterium]|nr:type VII secretion protein EssC [Lachnospiraceae bacterium]